MPRSKKRLEDKLSLVFSAPMLAFVAVVMFSVGSPVGLGPFLDVFSSILLGTVFLSVLPITPVVYYAQRGVVDLDVSERSRRPKLFALSLIGYSLGVICFHLTQSTTLMVLSVAYVCVTSSIALISLRWKISVHGAGIAGPVTGLTYVFGWSAALLYLLLLPIGWARLKLRAHTCLQFVGGALIAVLVTLIVYIVLCPVPIKPWF